MKKNSVLLILFFGLIILIKYFVSNYEIKYEIDTFSVVENYKDNVYYFEITDNDELVYNFKLYEKRSLSKKILDDIKIVENDIYKCIYPVSDKALFYPVCYSDNENLISYDLIDNEEINDFVDELKIKFETPVFNESEEFKFMDNVDDDTYIAVWKYNGFYLLKKGEVKTLDLFNKDRYSNDLSVLYKDKILVPNYDEDLVFSNFILLDIVTGEYEKVKSKFEISYDGYIAGTFKNNVYLFDNKNEKLYTINIKNGKVSLVGDEEKGFVKIENFREVKANLNEYKKDKITYFAELSKNNIKVKDNYRYYEENEDIKVKFMYDNEFSVVHIYKDSIYYLKDDNLYMYDNKSGSKLLLHYFELNFNDRNRIFIYNK